MGAGGQNVPADDDADITLAAPRFNEQAEEEARPVVPLRSVEHADDTAGPTRGPRVAFGQSLAAWPRGLVLALALVTGVALGAAVVYRGTRQDAPSPAPQTSAEATVGGSPAPAQPTQADVPSSPTREPKETEARSESRVWDESERRDRDEEGRDEHARKEEERLRREDEKRAERERKEAEKSAERQRREAEKRSEQKARLIGTITEKPEP